MDFTLENTSFTIREAKISKTKPNDNDEFFKNFKYGQQITVRALVSLYKKYKKSNDLHWEEYGSSKQGEEIIEVGEEFVTIWKDTGNASIGYKGKFKVSFVLAENIETPNDVIEIFECIYII